MNLWTWAHWACSCAITRKFYSHCRYSEFLALLFYAFNSRLRLTERQIATICKAVLRSLAYIHKLHIIHRDVKGDSILISSRGEIKLADFGISAQVSLLTAVEAATSPLGIQILDQSQNYCISDKSRQHEQTLVVVSSQHPYSRGEFPSP